MHGKYHHLKLFAKGKPGKSLLKFGVLLYEGVQIAIESIIYSIVEMQFPLIFLKQEQIEMSGWHVLSSFMSSKRKCRRKQEKIHSVAFFIRGVQRVVHLIIGATT